MIIIEKTKSIKQPFKVRYTGKNNETLSTSELLKSKKACFRNIYSLAICLVGDYVNSFGDGTSIEVVDKTGIYPEIFVYDIQGIKKKAGVRK